MTIFMSIDVLPEAVCCCLQTCNFIVIFMLMIMFVYKVLTSYKLICVSFMTIFMSQS